MRPGERALFPEGPLAQGEPPGSGLINTVHEVLATERTSVCQTPFHRSPLLCEIPRSHSAQLCGESDELLFPTS